MFADGNRQLIHVVSKLPSATIPRAALIEFVRGAHLVRSGRHRPPSAAVSTHDPGFGWASTESYAVAEEFYDIGQQRLAAAGVEDPGDVDLFTAVVSGLTHQQVANDPGGDRWVRLSGQAVAMYLAEVARTP
ncbi:hypothetical protein [Candidatus Neomicrothrix sp.]|uniref:hypothetical protein n=1 Tax=Candidatus Neomicrothrix sp. TaxID=2719034 RepID=UPI0025B9F552|nr:hypothetical protein [Candidatus Microthrix sp.]